MIELACKTLETPLTAESLVLALRTTLASKQYGSEDLLAKLVAEAVLAVMPRDPKQVCRHSLPLHNTIVLIPVSTLSSTLTMFESSRLWEEESTVVA